MLKHGKSLTFLDILGEAGLNEKEEAEADQLARDFLLPPSAWADFVLGDAFSAARAQAFAKAQGVAPGIVVGRLQFDNHIPYTRLNALKVKYEWHHDGE